jgi:hypothetical protein
MKTLNNNFAIVGINHRNDSLIDLTLSNGIKIEGIEPDNRYDIGVIYDPLAWEQEDLEIILNRKEQLEEFIAKLNRVKCDSQNPVLQKSLRELAALEIEVTNLQPKAPMPTPPLPTFESKFEPEGEEMTEDEISKAVELKLNELQSKEDNVAPKPQPGEDKTTQTNNTMKNVKEFTIGKWEAMLTKLGLFSNATKDKMEQAKAEAKRLFTKQTDEEKEQFINDNFEDQYDQNEVVEVVANATVTSLGFGLSWALGLWIAIKVATWAAIKGVGTFGVLVILYGLYFTIGGVGTIGSFYAGHSAGKKARTKYSRYQLAKIYIAGKKAEAKANLASK